jgi:hypothetical protein
MSQPKNPSSSSTSVGSPGPLMFMTVVLRLLHSEQVVENVWFALDAIAAVSVLVSN